MRPVPDLAWFDAMLQKLCQPFRPPERIQTTSGPVFRFSEKSIRTAILLKTARYISGLHAGQLLLRNGFGQELATVQRTLDDFFEDAIFLAMSCILDEISPKHQKYLKAFWEEEPEYQAFSRSPKKKDEVARAEIQNYIVRVANGGKDDHLASTNSKYMSRIYSGYVHGAASALMDMYNPQTRSFEVSGITSSFLLEDHEHDFQNYLFRGVPLIRIAAQALGVTEVADDATALHVQLDASYTK